MASEIDEWIFMTALHAFVTFKLNKKLIMPGKIPKRNTKESSRREFATELEWKEKQN